jgi:hypothetical protein
VFNLRNTCSDVEYQVLSRLGKFIGGQEACWEVSSRRVSVDRLSERWFHGVPEIIQATVEQDPRSHRARGDGQQQENNNDPSRTISKNHNACYIVFPACIPTALGVCEVSHTESIVIQRKVAPVSINRAIPREILVLPVLYLTDCYCVGQPG